jgi:hypothetical protein
VGSGKGKEIYLLFRMKELTNFAFALFAKSTCCFPLVFFNYYQMGYNSLRADSVLAGFSPRRRLLSNIFRADNSWVHHIVACLFASVGFPLFHLLSPRTSSCRAEVLGPEGSLRQNRKLSNSVERQKKDERWRTLSDSRLSTTVYTTRETIYSLENTCNTGIGLVYTETVCYNISCILHSNL